MVFLHPKSNSTEIGTFRKTEHIFSAAFKSLPRGWLSSVDRCKTFPSPPNRSCFLAVTVPLDLLLCQEQSCSHKCKPPKPRKRRTPSHWIPSSVGYGTQCGTNLSFSQDNARNFTMLIDRPPRHLTAPFNRAVFTPGSQVSSGGLSSSYGPSNSSQSTARSHIRP
jgi:hypothetical protein